ncbi:MAG TPA: tetratricopeptide repeat protein [Polyangia bacterium]|nr:tetratricopeptide repeat protein [Polyangia bacterium]
MIKLAPAALAVVLVAATLPSTASADDASVIAMEHFRRGTRAYDLGHFLEAVAEYEKAYEAKESPALLYNLGQAYRGAGDHQKALNAYRAYLRNSPTDAPNRDAAANFVEALRKTIELQKQTTEKPPVGTMPAPPLPSSTAKEPLQVVIVAPPPPEKRGPDLGELRRGKQLRIAGAAVGAFGLGTLVAGSVFAYYTAHVNDTLNNPPSTMPTYNKSLEQKGRTDQALETAFFAVGGAALVAGVTALVVGELAVKRNTFAFVPSVGPTHAAATFRVRF